jgi:hypothetical protein
MAIAEFAPETADGDRLMAQVGSLVRLTEDKDMQSRQWSKMCGGEDKTSLMCQKSHVGVWDGQREVVPLGAKARQLVGEWA